MLGRRPLSRSASRKREIVTVWIFIDRENYTAGEAESSASAHFKGFLLAAAARRKDIRFTLA
jgi:hypothetical protein